MTNDNANLEVIPASLDLTQNPRPNKKRRDADNQDFNFVDSGKIHYNKKSFQYYLQSVMTVRTHARVSKKSWLVSANGLRDTLEVVVVKRTINIKSTVPLNSTESLRRHFHAQNKENAHFTWSQLSTNFEYETYSLLRRKLYKKVFQTVDKVLYLTDL